jgi:hypothetical protein
MAAQAKRSGRPDAAARLADCLEKLATGKTPKGLKELT